MATRDGIKVLNFGLAKAINERPTQSGPDSPPLTMRATEAGLILGTAGYMSPEQTAGKNVDRRADIWAFGVVRTQCGQRRFAQATHVPRELPRRTAPEGAGGKVEPHHRQRLSSRKWLDSDVLAE